MRNILAFISLMICLSCNSNNAGKGDTEQIIRQLFEENGRLWNEYGQLWDEANGVILIQKLDSLYKEYGTKKFAKELIEDHQKMGLDHDLITYDYGFDDESKKTFNIQQIENDTYYVTYTVSTEDMSGKIIKMNAKLIVKVKIEAGKVRINEIYPDVKNE